MTAVYAVSDIHGHVDVLLETLVETGLVDAAGHWAGRDARLWFLGDYVDRGPDGVAVLDLVRRLVDESDGAVGALLGNHEILAMGMWLFGHQVVPHDGGRARSFQRSWTVCGGQRADQEGLTDDHLAWLRSLPVVARDGDFLLMHSDTLAYLDWGNSPGKINETAASMMRGTEIASWWELWRRMTSRHAFRSDEGPAAARGLLDALGGSVIVHGHSIAAELAEVPYVDVTEPLSYADDLVLAIDGGIYEGGPCLLTRLA
ncbi:metallophosphoesterase [Isoptericola hypogeus]|uniref:Metallophosphoesterase n=1 Tax=Isoptericola hypogeus TaxID=300179 RepID=A0ABN2JGZ3_9MICO